MDKHNAIATDGKGIKAADVINVAGDTTVQVAQIVFLPKTEGFIEDVRDLKSSLETQKSRATAITNLERLSHSSIVWASTLLYISVICSLIITLALVILYSELSGPIDATHIDLSTILAMYSLEGTFRTVAVAIEIWLLLSFPQRCFLHAYYLERRVLPEQTLLIILIFIFCITPAFSIVGPIIYWESYMYALNITTTYSANLNDSSQALLFLYEFSGAIGNSSQDRYGVNRVLVCIQLAFLLYTIGNFYHLLGQAENEYDKRYGQQSQSNGSSHSVKEKRRCCRKHGCCYTFYMMFWELAVLSSKRIMLLCSLYLILLLTTALIYDFTISSAPIFGIITVLKVCTDYIPCPTPGGGFQQYCLPNSTATPENPSTVLNCSPLVEGGLPFARAMCYTAIFIFEVIVFVLLHLNSKKIGDRLRSLSYSESRSKHLGFRYVRGNKHIVWSTISLVSILMISVPTTLLYIYNPTSMAHLVGRFTWNYSPLLRAGLNFEVIGFGPYHLLTITWIANICFAYLPPGSYGVIGWWRSPSISKIQERENDENHPVYIVKEDELKKLKDIREKEEKELAELERKIKKHDKLFKPFASHFRHLINQKKAGSMEVLTGLHERGSLQRQLSYKRSHRLSEDIEAQHQVSQDDQPNATEQIPVLVEAVHANIFILELQVLMWNFSHIAYEFGSPPPKPEPESIIDATSHSSNSHISFDVAHSVESIEKEKALSERKSHELNEKVSTESNKSASAKETTKVESTIPKPRYLTYDEKQRMIGDPRYKLVEHIENADTEIQCSIFSYFDETDNDARIVVAFRGTVTQKNVYSDLDYKMVYHKFAEEVPLPKINDIVARARATNHVPLVHCGFYLAYVSIREPLLRCLDNLLAERPDSVVFCTGHSLGGALAVHCAFDIGAASLRARGLCKKLVDIDADVKAFDIGVDIRKKERVAYAIQSPYVMTNEDKYCRLLSTEGRLVKAIHCTTFGSPRIGNYAFIERCQTTIQKTYRFVVQSDAVPKLPPAKPLGDIFKWGYHHVGVEVLMDLDGNIVLGPSFVEKQLLHGWRGYSTVSHFRTSYAWGLMLWCARVHSDTYVPDWWISVLNAVYEYETKRIEGLNTDLNQRLQNQLAKEGVIFFKNGIPYQSTGINPEPDFICDECNSKSYTSQFSLINDGSSSETKTIVDKDSEPNLFTATESVEQPSRESLAAPIAETALTDRVVLPTVNEVDEIESQGTLTSDDLEEAREVVAIQSVDEVVKKEIEGKRSLESSQSPELRIKNSPLSNVNESEVISSHRRINSLPLTLSGDASNGKGIYDDILVSHSSDYSPGKGVLRKTRSFTGGKKGQSDSVGSSPMSASGKKVVKFVTPTISNKEIKLDQETTKKEPEYQSIVI